MQCKEMQKKKTIGSICGRSPTLSVMRPLATSTPSASSLSQSLFWTTSSSHTQNKLCDNCRGRTGTVCGYSTPGTHCHYYPVAPLFSPPRTPPSTLKTPSIYRQTSDKPPPNKRIASTRCLPDNFHADLCNIAR